MGLTPQERFTVLSNIIARAGGMDKIDLRAELAKAEAGVNVMSNPMSQNQDVTGTFSPPMGTNPTQGEIMPEMPLNQGENMV